MNLPVNTMRPNLKTHLRQLLEQALATLQQNDQLPADVPVKIQIDHSRDRSHGDFACNVALMLAKPARRKPRELAELIVAALPASDQIAKVEIAGPGFINFFVPADTHHQLIKDILEQGEAFGRSNLGKGQRVQVEFVSANPTSALHVGHGRGAAFGATIANLLEATGFDVQREYYVNDAGRQMNILATSVWLRYLERCGQEVPFPSNGYRGDYIRDIAGLLYEEHGDSYAATVDQVMADVPPDEPQGGDKDAHVDALSERAKTLLGDNRYRYVHELTLNQILDEIRTDLAEFGVHYDEWFSEYTLTDSGSVNKGIERLREAGHVYEKDGALWFKATQFGDEKDRVVQRDNGLTTYMASDIAYLMNKFERGFERIIYVWGADHHGYVARLKAACQALGHDPDDIEILLVQFANLYRGGERVQMSSRSGDFVPLSELRAEVGNDAARFFYLMRKHEQHLDFDLDLAKSQSKDNPVYYIQYAHARVCSVLRKLAETGDSYDPARAMAQLERLMEEHEDILLAALARYPDTVANAALARDPHILANYLRELANAFHSYYDKHRMLIDDVDLRDARLALSQAVRQVVYNGLQLLGVSAPESM